MNIKLTSKERKKEFEKIFKDQLVPFFNQYGFERFSKTTHRFFKQYPNQLSVFIHFEFKTFGSGFYDISIAYYDEELGPADGDINLAAIGGSKPGIKATTVEILNKSAEEWMQKMKETIIPFIEKHSTHKAILEDADQFYFSKNGEQFSKELLKRKSGDG